MTPVVSVIVLCYNHERFVLDALESVRSQTFDDYELIVIDDASSDGSAAVIEHWIDSTRTPATFVRHETNQGLCRSLNCGLALAQGKYVAELSTDDTWEPRKLEVQTEILDRSPAHVAVVYSDAHLMDEDGHPLPQTFVELNRPDREENERYPHGALFGELVAGNFIPAMATLIRRSALNSVGGYDESLFFEDWDMWLRLSHTYEFHFSDYISATYRYFSQSMNHNPQNRARLQASAVRLLSKWRGVAPPEREPLAKKLSYYGDQLLAVDRGAALEAYRTARDIEPTTLRRFRAGATALGIGAEPQRTVIALSRLPVRARRSARDRIKMLRPTS